MPDEYPSQAKIYAEDPKEFDELNDYEFEIYIEF